MAVIFGPSPISLHSGQNISPGIQIPDDATVVRATLTHWNGQNTTDCLVQMSFDGGVSWRDRAAVGPSSSPSGTFKNRLDLWVQCDVWFLCGFTFPADSRYRPGQVCGEAFLMGQPLQLLVHSDYAFQDISGLPDLSPITFHDPSAVAPVAGPARQVRGIFNVNGNINSQLVVEAT